MKRTLFVYGSLAPAATLKQFRDAQRTQEEMHVLEVETLLPEEQRPKAHRWVNAQDLLSPETLAGIDAMTNDLLELYLAGLPTTEEVPLNRPFRSACLGINCRKWISPYQVNLELASRIFDGLLFDRICVAPGAGISFRAWQQVAEEKGLPLTLLPQEKRPFSLRRRLQRWLSRWRRKTPPVTTTLPEILASHSASVLCCSDRVARMLQRQKDALDLHWTYISGKELGAPSGPEYERLKSGYARWWQSCEAHLKESIAGHPGDTRAILLDLGRQQAAEVYPPFAWKYLRAKERLAKTRPQLLLCDSQEGSIDRAWILAAAELGIPVVAYTYDHIPQPRFSFSPDWLLCDSGRNAHIARVRGHPPERIVRVASHRTPPPAMQALTQPREKNIVYADSFYAGITATFEPQRSYRHYRLLVETARLMPDHTFHIKFHPLRDRKNVKQCFIGMDEDELHVRTKHIHALNPPPNLKLILPEDNMQRCIRAATAMLNSNSTAGVEAFVIGVPVVFIHPPNTDLGYPLIHEYEACLMATDAAALVRTLHQLENDTVFAERQVRNQRRYVDEFYWSSGSQGLASGIRSILVNQQTSPAPGVVSENRVCKS